MPSKPSQLKEIQTAIRVVTKRQEITNRGVADPRAAVEFAAAASHVKKLRDWVQKAHEDTSDPLRRIAFIMLNESINGAGIPANILHLWMGARVYKKLTEFQGHITAAHEAADFWSYCQRHARLAQALIQLRDLEIKAMVEEIGEKDVADILAKLI